MITVFTLPEEGTRRGDMGHSPPPPPPPTCFELG